MPAAEYPALRVSPLNSLAQGQTPGSVLIQKSGIQPLDQCRHVLAGNGLGKIIDHTVSDAFPGGGKIAVRGDNHHAYGDFFLHAYGDELAPAHAVHAQVRKNHIAGVFRRKSRAS